MCSRVWRCPVSSLSAPVTSTVTSTVQHSSNPHSYCHLSSLSSSTKQPKHTFTQAQKHVSIDKHRHTPTYLAIYTLTHSVLDSFWIGSLTKEEFLICLSILLTSSDLPKMNFYQQNMSLFLFNSLHSSSPTRSPPQSHKAYYSLKNRLLSLCGEGCSLVVAVRSDQ